MKYLVAFALLVLAVAEAHHSSQHILRGQRFKTNRLYRYDVEFNVTSGVVGLSTQVSKTTTRAEVSIYAKNGRDHLLKIEKVFTSGSVKAVEGWDGDVPLTRNHDLEDKLSEPIKFTLENGEVTSYTLSPRESLESKKIKKSILRSLEMHLPAMAIRQVESNKPLRIPITYNTTKNTDSGMHTTHYLITVSPYPEFPAEMDVYNMTRSDNFEAERYPAHKMHHNFYKQGCPEVCRKGWRSNEYGAGCPMGHEPHHTPIKTSFTHEHHLSLHEDVMNPEIVRTTEIHVAQMYDQDMEVMISYQMRRKTVTSGSIAELSDQQTYTDIKDMEAEINENEINELCNYKTSQEAVTVAKKLLEEITKIVVNGDLEDRKSTILGEKVILLKNALIRLSVQDLEAIAREYIVKKSDIKQADVAKKVKRQIWLDMLPLLGTEESVTFIIKFIKNIDQNLLVWEAKEILEALPQNIENPSERNVRELRSLMTDRTMINKMKQNPMLHSAVYMTLASTLGGMCGSIPVVRSEPVQQRSSWFSNYQNSLRRIQSVSSDSQYVPSRCPRQQVTEVVKDITQKLYNSENQQEIAVYVNALSRIGISEVLPVIAQYSYGVAENMQTYTPRFVEFIKRVALYSLHHVAEKNPEEVLEIVLPMFFNRTETPKVRNAAFSVILRCQPSLEVLEHVAHQSWSEVSNDVASFVTSNLETFGNSSLPCMQLTAQRIRKVMPHVKKYNLGVQHAKKLLWTYFDEQREFGLEGLFAYTPNNESFIPSSIYKSLTYSTDSLRDAIIQMSLNIEGLTQHKIFKYIDQYILGIDSPKPIPESIFAQANLVERIPDKLRFTLYRRMFYSSSFYYFDEEHIMDQMKPFFEYMDIYLRPNRYDVSGQLVKVALPSSFHSVAIAKTLPYPVKFQMIQPLILSLKVKFLERDSTLKKFNLHFRPSIYFTKLYTHQFKNLGDCMEVGVYHEHKLAVSFPFEIKSEVSGLLNWELSYKLPELEKTIFKYFSETGTYAAKKTLEKLPSSAERVAITTIPTPFKIEKKVDIIGIPPMDIGIHTEDIQLVMQKMPKSPVEALNMVMMKMMNAGWRQKSVNITLKEDSKTWPRDTEVTFKFMYNRNHVTMEKLKRNKLQSSQMNMNEESSWYGTPEDDSIQSQWNQADSYSQQASREDEDWSKNMKPDDISSNKNPKEFIEQGKMTTIKLSNLPHIMHKFIVEVVTKPVHSTAWVKMEYNHTYSGYLHAVHVDAAVENEDRPRVITVDHLMAFLSKENEFKYTDAMEHMAVFLTSFRAHQEVVTLPWEKMDVVAKGMLHYRDPKEFLSNDLLYKINPKNFLPQTHVKCLKDVQEGEPQSMDCVKALREHSIYNNMQMSILWKRNLPEIIKTVSRKADLYMKHILFNYMNITDEINWQDNIQMSINYIDKFTDKPIIDMKVWKPEETLGFRKVPTFGVQPLSSIYSLRETSSMEATNNTYPSTCVMMMNYVKTFDKKSIHFMADRCEYVLATHCTPNKLFAITAKALDIRKGTKEVRMYIGKNTLILTPKSGSVFKIKFNDMEYSVGLYPVVFEEESDEIYAVKEGNVIDRLNGDHHLRIVARKAGINVLYDGVNIKVQVAPTYKGELCGLCSEFDGEELREYRGLDRCLYSHPIDFVNSNIIKRKGYCEKGRLTGEVICEGEDTMHNVPRKNENESIIPRNIVKRKGNQICFSTLPVPVCSNEREPMETESQTAEFVCMYERDPTARELRTESKKRTLSELAHRRPQFETEVEVAKMC